MVLDMFLLYNLTEFLRALAYCLSKAFALCGSSFFPLRKLELAYNPTELIGELQFTNCESLLHDDMTELRSLDFLRTYLCFVVSSHLLASCSLRPSTTLADFSRARDSQISFSVTHGWSAFWRGRPWLAGHRIGETSSDVGSSRFWIGWVTKHGDKCARSTCRD